MTSPSPHAATKHPVAEVVVYARPGCPYCVALRAGLRRGGVKFREVNIWDDQNAAAFVRSVANGNETVPTVTVGTRALVNPTVRHVRSLVNAGTEGTEGTEGRGPGGRWWSR